MKTLIDDTVKLIEIENKQEAIELGRGAGWCTSPTSGRNYYDTHYHPGRGRLFVVRKRRPEYQIFLGKERNHLEIRGRGNSTTYLPKLLDKYPILTDFFKSTLGIIEGGMAPHLHVDTERTAYATGILGQRLRGDVRMRFEQIVGVSDLALIQLLDGARRLIIEGQRGSAPIHITSQHTPNYHGIMLRGSQRMLNNQMYEVTQIVGDDVLMQRSNTQTIMSHAITTIIHMLNRKWDEVSLEVHRGLVQNNEEPGNYCWPARDGEDHLPSRHRARLPGNEF